VIISELIIVLFLQRKRTSGGKAIFPPPTFLEKNYMVRISIEFSTKLCAFSKKKEKSFAFSTPREQKKKKIFFSPSNLIKT
jgi:hypothetical protein